MARPSDLLRRFRLMAVPGKARIAGVPVDHAALLREELAPVFAALRPTQGRADDIVSLATAEADRRLVDAALESQRIFDEASNAQPGARAAAAATTESEASSTGSQLWAVADEEVERINREASVRITPVVDELVRRVLSTGVAPGASP